MSRPLQFSQLLTRPVGVAVAFAAAVASLAVGCGEQPTEVTSRPVHPGASAEMVTIEPGGSLRDSVVKYPAGTVFLLKTGVHRLQFAVPKSGMSFLGEGGTVLSGARLLTTFSQVGTRWAASGQTQQGNRTSATKNNGKPICKNLAPRCYYPEELFIDDVRQRHVGLLSGVKAGTWYFDYDADIIYIGTNPAGRKVETSVTPRAFSGAGSNIVIRGLVIEKYATPFMAGAVQADGTGWIIEDNEVRFNHAIGIETNTGTVARGNNVHHNLQLGMAGAGDGALIEDNEIAYQNNPQMINYGWSAGGTKFHNTQNLVLRNNFVHHNLGPGLWTDIDNIYTLIEYNRVEDNSRFGIYREISYDAVIRYNTASRNGFALPNTAKDAVRGGGIAIRSSSNVEIYGNTVADNKAGIDIAQVEVREGRYGTYGVVNLYVHDNVVRMTKGFTGMTASGSGDIFYTARNNRFVNNTYELGSQERPFWWWNAALERQDSLTVEEWQAAGQDVTGTFTR